MPSLSAITASPMLREFAQGAAQSAVQPVADFLAPTVEVPTSIGRYKIYSEKNRFAPPDTSRAIGGRATVLSFDASDATYNCQPNALDFPIDYLEQIEEAALTNALMEGATIVAEVAALCHEQHVINTAVASTSGGAVAKTWSGSSGSDPIDDIDAQILNVIKAARYGSLMGVGVLFGAGAWRLFKNAPNVRGRFVAAGDYAIPNVTPAEATKLFVGNPEVRTSYMVVDTTKEGLTPSVSFLLDTSVLVFARLENPTRRDPSFMKTFRLMGNYIGIASLPDMIHLTNVALVPITGTSVGTVSTTAAAASGSSTITLPSTAISGMTNGLIYSVTGNSAIPAGACFIYNASSTTQTLGTEKTDGSGVTTGLVATGAVSGAVRLTFINNAWSPCWYVDVSGNVGIMLRVGRTIGNAYAAPGIGYITCSNPGTFTNWSDFTALSGVHSNANMGSILNLSGTWYLFTDEGNSVRGFEDLSYYTASAPTGPFTYQGFMGIGAAYQAAFTGVSIESNQPLYLGGANWRVNFANQSTGGQFYTESTSGLTGTWSAPVSIGFKGGSYLGGVGAGHPFFLSNSDDAFAMEHAVPTQPYGFNMQWRSDLGRASMLSIAEYANYGGPSSTIQFNPGSLTFEGQIDGIMDFGTYMVGTPAIYLYNGGSATQRYGWGIQPYAMQFFLQSNAVFEWCKGGDLQTVGTNELMKLDAATGNLTIDSGNIVADSVGKGIQVKEGANAKQGTATLVAGTVTISNTSVTTNSRFFLTSHGSTVNAVGISAVVAGTSFTLKSASGSDTNTIDYEIFEPAP